MDIVFDIVVVDDDELMLKLVEYKLRKTDYTFKCFNDEMDALEYLKNNPTKVLVVDQRMPQLDGIELIQKLQETTDKFAEQTYLYSSAKLCDDTLLLASECHVIPMLKDDFLHREDLSGLFVSEV